jgi:hypothetical protein
MNLWLAIQGIWFLVTANEAERALIRHMRSCRRCTEATLPQVVGCPTGEALLARAKR